MLLVKGVCCRVWPMLAFTGIGRCGLCGQRPTVEGVWEDYDPDCLDCWGTGRTTLNPDEPDDHVCWRFATND